MIQELNGRTRGSLTSPVNGGILKSETMQSSREIHADVLKVRLTAIHFAAQEINLYELECIDGCPLPEAEPGSHIDLHLPNGMVRQYSIVNPDPRPMKYVIGVKRDQNGRGGSRYMHDELKVGSFVQISVPRNNFHMEERAQSSILIAGGIGITPIWAMVQRLMTLGNDWKLYYACRSRADMAFHGELTQTGRVYFHFDDENRNVPLDLGSITTGAPKNSHLYCCGPLPMLKDFAAVTADWPEQQVHMEYFSAEKGIVPKGGFVVELARSRKEFYVPPGSTILNVLKEASIDVAFSCEEGLCGLCETRVISGTPEHRDLILTSAERAANKVVMICCAGCKSDKLVLDL